MSRVWLRAGALALGAAAIVAGLTIYFSSETVPPCLVSGAPTWRAPKDRGLHRYVVVFPERAACFFAIDRRQELVGALRLSPARGISTVAPLLGDVALRTETGPMTLDLQSGRLRRGGLAPFASDLLTVTDTEHGVMYVTQRRLLGFRVVELKTGITRYVVRFKGFTWNPRFGPQAPSHGLSLAPDRPELWVLDAPNGTVHVFDVSALPARPPRQVDDIRLSEPLSGDENPCSRACRRIGSLLHSTDGRFVYVGDAGDVIDTQTRKKVANLEALHNSRVQLEVEWRDGRPVFPRPRS
jgi:hypothetical protein